jgi:hypothetical protein
MANRLQTIASFDALPQAQIARDALIRAGIQAVLTDQETVSLFWHLSNAIGGIKVQVLEENAERAVAILEESLGPAEDVDPDELAEEAEAAAREEEEGASPSPQLVAPSFAGNTAVVAPQASCSRDDYARRAFFMAWLGLAFPPVWVFVLYFFLNAAFGQGELSRRGRYQLCVMGALMVFASIAFWLILRAVANVARP